MSNTGATPGEPSALNASVPGEEWWERWHDWPIVRVLLAARLGLRPAHVGLAFVALVATVALMGMATLLDGWLVSSEGQKPLWIDALPLPWAFVAWPAWALWHYPLTTVLAGPVLLVTWALVLGGIARLTAEEFCRSRMLTWTEVMQFAVRFWRPLVAVVLWPVAILWLLALLLAIAGLVFLRWPGVNVLGAVLYGPGLIAGLLAAILAGVYTVSLPMLIPAVVCEGSDSFDASQRAFSYAVARLPLLLVYAAVATAGVMFVVLIAALIARWAVEFTALAAGAWAGDRARQAILYALPRLAPGELWALHGLERPAQPTGTFRAAAWLLGFWHSIPAALVGATLVSTATSAATVLYLAMRRACDHQDMNDLWSDDETERGGGASEDSTAPAPIDAPSSM